MWIALIVAWFVVGGILILGLSQPDYKPLVKQ